MITDPIYPYPYRVVITTLVAEQLDAYPDLCYVSDMPWPESWPIMGGDVAFADSAATRKDSTSVGGPPKAALPQMWRRPEAASFLVAAESATSSPLIGRDSGHGMSDTYHRSG